MLLKCFADLEPSLTTSLSRFEGLTLDAKRTLVADCMYGSRNNLMAYLVSAVGNMQDAEDIFQEACVRLVEHVNDVEGYDLNGYAYMIVRNLVRDFFRKMKRRERLGFRCVSLSDELGCGDRGDSLCDPDLMNNPLSAALLADERDLIMRRLNQLEEKYRQLVILRDLEGRSYEEIVVLLGVNLGTVKSRLNRAREALGVMLRDAGDYDSRRAA